MNLAEKLLVKKLSPLLLPLGFKWLRARETYVRQETHGFSSLCWSSYTSHEEGGRLEIIPLLGVRHDAIEEVVNPLGLIYGDDNKRYTTTVSRGLQYFPFQEEKIYTQYIYLDSGEKDIEQVAEALTSLVTNEGEGFFKKYASLLACSQGLNEPIGSKAHPLCNHFPNRAYYGIATAWFAENERVPDLVNRYLKFTQDVLPNKYGQVEKRIDQLLTIARGSSTKDHGNVPME